ncbi:glyoxalase/bleomycin resistance/extradiol dioxygenase family protein [Ralstonia pseudosolanacearum]|uniref:VOC family protein n=1 Tax=Ralstonia pseudosolanacearum TaxID=1310165 RepID=UPI00267555B0|nr:glyoxalase/bleomycin resistance/extradiol dioxygenase family protein [Ralstonia pseudosolanacearum]MDO3562025.1 glyoxalase/bleomycin resistance/extradiol dioxygenase family protein [Ralstonia pseudosolanacearum]MDO3569764.1 glyoxalase/bleomycin resistance/extradiol dioxygenase family protein [Ralstonia pseudosolanacearum]MDO3615493.1 glyoxalase/bleomycin resistance/extradiol dioxygenase family protein [Ralstonia pseudosolanacearum]MDO3619580.1 glyoxalase/bleomycin resistance/extradiol dioxyg
MSFPRPANTPWLVPYLTVHDAAAAIAFYRDAFGFGVQDAVHDHGRPIHVEMTYQGQLILMFAPNGAFGSTARAPAAGGFECPQSFHLYCEDVDAVYRRALEHGATSIMPPDNVFWGERYAAVRDPDGYRWGLACHPAGAPA